MSLDLKDRLYTSSEVAEILGVSLRSVYRYLEEGKLDADIKTATGRHRFSKKNILDFLKPQDNESNTNVTYSNTLDEASEDLSYLTKPLQEDVKKEEPSDDFNFDFDEEFFKTLEDMSRNIDSSKPADGDAKLNEDDELEKLLKEFEDSNDFDIKTSEDAFIDTKPNTQTHENNINNSKITEEGDFELDRILKSLENGFDEEVDIEIKEIKNAPEAEIEEIKPQIQEDKKDSYFDFDMDFDFGFLDNKEEKEEINVKSNNHAEDPRSDFKDEVTQKVEEEDDDSSEDNWLERFRKAAERNTPKKEAVVEEKKNVFDNFFEDKSENLDVFFDKKTESVDSIGISSLTSLAGASEVEEEVSVPRSENYYISEFNNLKEIAQTLDKVAQKFDLDYAFTLNAGLSLHKPIAPFSIIHAYVNNEDLEIFEDYLKLTPCSEKEASICLVCPESKEIFEDAHELHGLYVVSNVQLRSDLIDKGLDKLAREI